MTEKEEIWYNVNVTDADEDGKQLVVMNTCGDVSTAEIEAGESFTASGKKEVEVEKVNGIIPAFKDLLGL